MTGAPEGVRTRAWVVVPLVVLGLMMVVGLTASIVERLRGDDTYEAAKLVALPHAAFDSIESIANSEVFRLEVADAADVDASDVQVSACRPGQAPFLQVSVRHHDRDATVDLVAVVVPTLNRQLEGGRSVSDPGTPVPDPARELGTSGVKVVDPDDAPGCDFVLPES